MKYLKDYKVFESPSNHQTSTSEFKEWFGNSKVVNPDGSPMVVYHGTPNDFDSFETNKNGLIFVSDDPIIASKYASNDFGSRTMEISGRIVNLFVKAENIFDPEKFSDNSEFIEALAEKGDFSQVKKSRFDNFNDLAEQALYDGIWSVLETKEFIDYLKEKGFDGIYIDNRSEYLQLDGISTKNRDIAVFSPTQVKSATSSQGKGK